MRHLWKWVGATLILSACAGGGDSPSSEPGTIRSEGSEAINDESSKTISGPTLTLQTHAQFQRFDDYGYDSGSDKGLVQKNTYNIRYAEVQLFKTSTNTLLQAGTTQSDGTLSGFLMPATAGTYRLEVHSRANNNFLKASVLNNPYDKDYYTISATFTLTGSESGTYTVTLPVAPASINTTLEGGAFNILYDIALVNDYLRAHANGQTSSNSNPDYCPALICAGGFTVAPKVQVYWTKGLTPATYYGAPTSPISFFVPQSGGGIYEGLYILGGIEDDLCVDTDHFDNSVIIHEYGHFLEHSFAISDSPGGSHNGNGIIDPRLAWSEGWADFFQSIVLARSFYRDTKSNNDCGNPQLSFTDFGLSAKVSSGYQDYPDVAGEGNFREMSVARMLRSTVVGASQGTSYPANSPGVEADFGFATVWQAFKNLTDTSMHFRSVGHMNMQIYSFLSNLGLTPASNAWNDDAQTAADTSTATAVLPYEKHRRDLKDFGHPLTSQSGASCTGTNSSWFPRVIGALEPVGDIYSDGYIVWSDVMNTNDFFAYYYDGTSAHSIINLNYKTNSGVSTPYDLDMYLYKDGFAFLEGSDILKKSEGYYGSTEATPDSGYTGKEVIKLSGLPAGTYMINIKVDYASGGTRKAATQYSLKLGNGELLCP